MHAHGNWRYHHRPVVTIADVGAPLDDAEAPEHVQLALERCGRVVAQVEPRRFRCTAPVEQAPAGRSARPQRGQVAREANTGAHALVVLRHDGLARGSREQHGFAHGKRALLSLVRKAANEDEAGAQCRERVAFAASGTLATTARASSALAGAMEVPGGQGHPVAVTLLAEIGSEAYFRVGGELGHDSLGLEGRHARCTGEAELLQRLNSADEGLAVARVEREGALGGMEPSSHQARVRIRESLPLGLRGPREED
mmetsp:Transcript_10564/g.31315  ORF Transcript_10564/g.31315 Transcript_10564/m.31315 type:complete len:255 (-) Transcript_10564:312-1076(-)